MTSPSPPQKRPREPSCADWAVEKTPFPAFCLAARSARTVKFWLDVPPQDVRNRIAAHVSEGARQTESLLSLARSSPLQAEAVLAVLSYSLCINTSCVRASELADWAEVFQRDIRQLVLDNKSQELLSDLPMRTHGAAMELQATAFATPPPALFSAPYLRRIEVFVAPWVLDAIKLSSSVSHISLVMLNEVDCGDPSLEQILHALAALQQSLKSLALVCIAPLAARCPFHKLLDMYGSGQSLADVCPLLTSLSLSCCAYTPLQGETNRHAAVAFLWRCLPTLRSLHDVAIKGELSDDMIPMLRGIQSVRLVSHNAFRVATKLGHCLAALRTSEVVHPLRVEIPALSQCIRLEVLELTLQCEAESEFFAALRQLKSLRSLTLQWLNRGVNFPEIPKVVNKGDMLSRVVENAPLLSELHLINIHMPVSHMTAIVERMGKRLQHLSYVFVSESTSAMDRYGELPALLEAIGESCLGLRSLNVGDRWARLGKLSEADVPARAQLKNCVLSPALRRLQRVAPMLDVSDAEAWILKL